MASLVLLLLRQPLKTIQFIYSFTVLLLLAVLRRLLLPHFPSYQSLRIQIHRAFLSATSTTFPDLARRLPVGDLPQARAKKIQHEHVAYLIPGEVELPSFSSTQSEQRESRCIALYAHGGGYARGEARMYVDYMERWVKVAKNAGLNLLFVSVEYRKCPPSSWMSHEEYHSGADQFLQHCQRNLHTRRKSTHSSPHTGSSLTMGYRQSPSSSWETQLVVRERNMNASTSFLISFPN